MQDKNEEFINLLSAEMVEEILAYLKPKELVTAALASKATFFVNAKRQLALNNEVHKRLIDRAHAMSTDVAHGKQAEVEELLVQLPSVQAQELLLTRAPFTDYSGRTFHCTAYEYAYWAKDTHMCRMLEHQMDADTKRDMLKRCEAIENDGLTYKQHGVEVKGSKHFDFTPLKTALTHYLDGFDNWLNTRNKTALEAAWMAVGLAQRDVPVHVMNEYCRPDRSFKPTPTFNEDELPRVLTYYHLSTGRAVLLFPLVFSDTSGLGVDFALVRGLMSVPGPSGCPGRAAGIDLLAG
ncbi:hypothetical protein ACM9VS_05780 [Legionella pneumophila]|uniref:hypothetical protein n=1 Tax=Legionella pneumophila TaxID=446 RepID=UPI003A4C5BC5